ncbi:MAG: formate transporter FocA [Anaerolineae bacterium]
MTSTPQNPIGTTGQVVNLATSFSVDAFIPPEMAVKAETVGVKKATMGPRNTLALSVLAGAFIAMGAIFSTTAVTGLAGEVPFGQTRLIAGLTFCLGLILVVVAGAELFTGNNLIVMAWADGRLRFIQVLRNWTLVYIGNFIGALATAVLMLLSKQYTFSGGAVGLTALNIANSKCVLDFMQALVLGILCNALVCLAVWLCFSARTTTDKILSIVFPITAFVAAGFEHSIANMYFIPIGLLIKQTAAPEFWTAIGKTAADYGALTWSNFFLRNLLPVTIGNIIGGAVMVGLVYWFIYIRKGWTKTTDGKQ